MELIIPERLELAKTGSSPVYIYPAWVAGTYYTAGTVVRGNSTGVWRDYRAVYSHTSSAGSPPPFRAVIPGYGFTYWPRAGDYWLDLGDSGVSSGYVYTTNVRLSNAPAWTTGAVQEGATAYDPADQRDYRAMIAMTSAENALRPSSAIISTDEVVRSRWLDLGAANAWAPLDYRMNSYLYGYAPSGALLSSVTFSVAAYSSAVIDRIAFAGLIDVQSVSVRISVNSVLLSTVTGSLVPSGESYGLTKRTLVLRIPNPIAISALQPLRLDVTLTPVLGRAAQLAVMCVGRGIYLSGTEWGVETSAISFSSKTRNDTFGTTTFNKRGSARSVRASCLIDPRIVGGDVVQQVLINVDGMPVYWDFNNNGSDYDRLRVFGFHSNMRMAIQAHTFESLSLDVEGLVE